MKDGTENNTLVRMRAAERVLELMESGELPRVKHFIFGGYEVRSIADGTAFEEAWAGPTSLKKELKASERRFTICPVKEGNVGFYIFHEKCRSEVEAKLWAETMQSYLAATYAALGMDMSALAKPESKKPYSNED